MTQEQNLPVVHAARDAVTWIWLNQPQTRNTLSETVVVDALVQALLAADADPACRVIVLSGRGSAFSAGGNVKDMATRQGLFAGDPATLASNYRRGIQRIPQTFSRLHKPVIAAVNGPAYGAGCDLAMMCDLRIAATSAVFAENFVRLGLIPGDGGAWFLPRAIGPARAAQMALTGDPVDAQTALAWGMVSQVVADEALEETAQALAERIAANPPQAVQWTRTLLRDAPEMPLAPFLEDCARLQGMAHHTQDHAEAVAAFLERRPPHFQGR